MKAELIDFMGTDERVVDSARVSFDKIAANYTDNQNHKLIKYLADHNHWSPFSHIQITMRETVPIFVARQRFKHVVGFTYNEVSRRYVDDKPEFYRPESWRLATDNKKQGSSDETITHFRNEEVLIAYSSFQKISESYDDFLHSAWYLYKDLVDSGVAPEQARMVLPQSMYTSYYCTGSLAAWARAYKLRIDPHAQKEIQDLAVQWNDIISNIPELKHSWNALTR